MADLYTGGGYAERHPGWHREHSEWKAGQVLKMVRRHGLSPGEIAEIGCGAGGFLAALQRGMPAECRFTGYDIAPAAIELARALENDRLKFVCGDLSAVPGGVFDLLLTMDVVEHVEDYLGFLRAIRPLARAHILHLPLDLSLLSERHPERLTWARESVGHLHYFTAGTALAALRNAGFTVADTFYTAVELDQPPPAGQLQRLRALRRIGRGLSPAWSARLLGGFSLLVLCR